MTSRTITRRRTTASTLAVSGLLTAGLWSAAPAIAHDQLLSAEPAGSATLEAAPTELSLTFSGNLITGQGIQNLVQVTDAEGNQWQDGDVDVTGPELTVALCEGMPNGDYDVAYRVVYSDGHSEEKEYSFAVADPQGPDAGAPAEGCGVAVAGTGGGSDAVASPTATGDDTSATPPDAPSNGATASGPDAPTSDAGATDGAGSDGGAQATDSPATVDTSGEESSDGLPSWVWAAGFGGVAVVVVGLVLVARKAKNLN